MSDFFTEHGSEILIGLFTILGALVGTLVPTIYNYFRDKNERKDKYFFSMIKKRFEVYSEASNWCEILKDLIHKSDDMIFTQTRKARDWFSQNNLYLEPKIRIDFFNFILEVEMYKNRLEDFQITKEQEGIDSEQTQKKKEELKNTFREIRVGIQRKIQNTIDVYYDKSGINK